LPIVLAYHGCDLETAQELLGGSPLKPSTKDCDWLGEGSYFWENDALRAYQWATEPRRKFKSPSVVGSVIELGKCLDLMTQSGIAAVKVAYDGFMALSGDKTLRRLDCAVMNYLFEILETAGESDPNSQPYQTVRALFPEGNKLCTDAGFLEKTHIQICVREPEQILGVFRIPEWQRVEIGLPNLY
jgi:hypothetical protein